MNDTKEVELIMNKVWKYFSLAELYKFETLINGEIYFARADKFEDRFEGAIPFRNLQGYIDWMSHEDDENEREKVREEFRNKFKDITRKVVISCWHLNEDESPEMWEKYGKGHGLAVSTTIDRLLKLSAPNGFALHADKVSYSNLETEYKEDYFRYDLLTFLNKGIEFEYENEYRLILYQLNNTIPSLEFFKYEQPSSALVKHMFLSKYKEISSGGVKVKTNITEIIDEIVASPNMNGKNIKEIQEILDVVNTENGSKFAIRHSELCR
jgi:hypothetical protein